MLLIDEEQPRHGVVSVCLPASQHRHRWHYDLGAKHWLAHLEACSRQHKDFHDREVVEAGPDTVVSFTFSP